MNIWVKLQEISLMAPPILLAVTVHEVAHGLVADKLGDPTARLAGRLTFNPFKHLDFWGTVVFIVTGMIGWAKPVPVNAHNLKNPKRDMFWVALAGPASNVLVAFILSLGYRFMGHLEIPKGIWFNIAAPLYLMLKFGVVLNLGLACFNLIPIPPLDGSHLVEAFLPESQLMAYRRLTPYGIILLLLLVFTGAIDYLIIPPLNLLIRLFLG